MWTVLTFTCILRHYNVDSSHTMRRVLTFTYMLRHYNVNSSHICMLMHYNVDSSHIYLYAEALQCGQFSHLSVC